MANEHDIKIAIETTANTAGAEKTTAALDETKRSISAATDATRKLQQAEDVAEAKSRLSERNLSLKSGQLKNLGNVANQVGFQVTDFAVQVQGGQSAVTAMSQQLPQLIGAMQQLGGATGGVSAILSSAVSGGTAFSLIATELAIGGKLAADAYQEMAAAIRAADNAVANFKNILIPAEQQLRSLNAAIRQEGAAARFLEDAAAAKLLNDELAHANELAKARASLENTRARIGGAPSDQQAVQGVEQLAEQFQRDLAAAIARKQAAQDAFLNQAGVVAAFPTGSSIAEVDAAKAKLAELETQVASATAAVVRLGELNSIKLEEAGLAATQSVTDAAQAAFTKTGEDLRAQLQQIQATEGAATSAAVVQSLQAVNQILADGKVSADEVGKLGSALQIFRQSMEAGTQETQRQINALISLTQQQAAGLAASNRAIESLTAQVSGQPQN